MGVFQCFWLVCSLLVLIHGAPKPPGEIAEHGNKELTDIEESLSTTQVPDLTPDLSPELPENWDQTKDDVSTLFLNRSDKTELPYPMALADDSYDGRPIRDDAPLLPKPSTSMLDHVIMRSELYGEPPSMNRDNLRRKRANTVSLRSDLGSSHSRVSKMAPRYSTIHRRKRNSFSRNNDVRELLSLWEAEQRKREEESIPYYARDQYLNQDYFDGTDRDDTEEHWLDEPLYPSTHFSHSSLMGPRISNQPKLSRYQYSYDFPEIISSEPTYLQNLEAIRRKRQWSSGLRDRLAKKNMMAKRSSNSNYFRPREDLYFLDDLLRNSEMNANPNTYPVKRRLVL